jgi:hypothetical protein
MGAVVAHLVGKAGRRAWPDLRTLVAAGAAAGLAVAFNAPIAGAVFVLEELVRRPETRVAISALGRLGDRDPDLTLVSRRHARFPGHHHGAGGARNRPVAVRRRCDLAALPDIRGHLRPCRGSL